MALLQKAVRKRSSAKIAGFGPGGSGKSLTLNLLALGLSKTYHNGAPIALYDTEEASDWLLDVYEAEGVELHRVQSKAFVDMRAAEKEAREAGCCAFLADSYSHPWADLQASLKKRLNVKKLEFHHMQELQELWQEWVSQFLSSPLHILLAGRLAYEWENEQDVETGRMGFHKAGTKMRSEKDAGYEPHLLFEMEAVRVMEEIKTARGAGNRTKRTRLYKKAGGHFLHRLHVLKDRARILNGKMFEFKDINDYKPGGWKLVFDALRPHFEKIAVASGVHEATESTRTSEVLFSDRGDSAFRERSRNVEIAIEEFQGTLRKLWPGETAKEKALRAFAVESIFGTRSDTKWQSMSLEQLERGLAVLKGFETATGNGFEGALTDAAVAAEVLGECKEARRAAEEAAVM